MYTLVSEKTISAKFGDDDVDEYCIECIHQKKNK